MSSRLCVEIPDAHRYHSGSLSVSSRASSYSPGKSPAGPKSTRSRKGGFGDSGTLGSGGELPIASEVHVRTERELSDEINTIAESLHPNIDWEKRVHALLRLEGLVKGGVTSTFPNQFSDMLSTLNGLLAAQLQDRRSAVSRQACHVVSVLVEACGTSIESLVVGLQSPLLKAPGMSIQIVTEAAEACFRTILRHCPSARLLPQLFTTVRLDKNVKLRQFAAEYILQAIQEWEPVVYERSVEALEEAILAASSDASGETREAGRASFVAYYAKKPAAARMMLMRLPDTEYVVRDKLAKAVHKAHGPDCFKADATATISLTRQISSKSSTTAPPSLRRPPSPNITTKRSSTLISPSSSSTSSIRVPVAHMKSTSSSSTLIAAKESACVESLPPPPTTLGRAKRVPKVAIPSPRSNNTNTNYNYSREQQQQYIPSRSTTPTSPPVLQPLPPPTTTATTNTITTTIHGVKNNDVDMAASQQYADTTTKATPRRERSGGVVSMLSNAAASVRRTLSSKSSPNKQQQQQQVAVQQQGGSGLQSMQSVDSDTTITIPSMLTTTGGGSKSHRRSLGGALRIASSTTTATIAAEQQQQQQQMMTMPTPFASTTTAARRVINNNNQTSPKRPNPSPRGRTTASIPSPQPARIAFMEALNTLSTTKPLWSKKVTLYESIQGHLEESTVKELTDNTPLMNRFVDTLLDGVSDAHFKVASAALSALIAALRSPVVYPQMTTHVEFLVPALFARISDGKEHIRQLIGATLSIFPHVFDIEYVIHGLVVAVNNAKNPKTLSAVMEYFAEMAGDSIPGRKHPADTVAGKNLLTAALSLAAHKNPDVRQSALGALAAVYSTGHAADVESAIATLPSSPQAAVTRALALVLDPVVQQQVQQEQSISPAPVIVVNDISSDDDSDDYYQQQPPRVRSKSRSPAKSPSRLSPHGSMSNLAVSSPSREKKESPAPSIPRRRSFNTPYNNDTTVDTNTTNDYDDVSMGMNAMSITTPASQLGSLSTPRPSSSMTRRLQQQQHTHLSQAQMSVCQTPSPTGDASAIASWQSRPFSGKYNKSPPPCVQILSSNNDGETASSPYLINSPGSAFLLSSKNLPQLLVELRKNPSVAAMHIAPGLAHGLGEKEVETLCSAVCEGLLSTLRSGMDDSLQVASLEAFIALCPSMTTVLSKFGPSLIEQFIKASTRGHDVAFAAESASKALMSRLDPVKGLSMILPHMPEVDERPPFDGDRAKSVLQVIKMLSSAIQNVTSSQLLAVLGSLMPSLSYCYSSANAEIRKTSVACIVKAYQIVGKRDMERHLSVLTVAQQKLVSLYIERAENT